MTSSERRELARAITRLGPDADALALQILCRLADCPVPVRQRRTVSRVRGVTLEAVEGEEATAVLRAVGADVAGGPRPGRYRGSRPATRAVGPEVPQERLRAQPKPPSRVVNPRAITVYKKAVKLCETPGPDCHGPLDFSHIKAKSQGGDDIPETNGLIQCRVHHDLYEASRMGWWRAVHNRLTPEARSKVLAVYPDLASSPEDQRR